MTKQKTQQLELARKFDYFGSVMLRNRNTSDFSRGSKRFLTSQKSSGQTHGFSHGLPKISVISKFPDRVFGFVFPKACKPIPALDGYYKPNPAFEEKPVWRLKTSLSGV